MLRFATHHFSDIYRRIEIFWTIDVLLSLLLCHIQMIYCYSLCLVCVLAQIELIKKRYSYWNYVHVVSVRKHTSKYIMISCSHADIFNLHDQHPHNLKFSSFWNSIFHLQYSNMLRLKNKLFGPYSPRPLLHLSAG